MGEPLMLSRNLLFLGLILGGAAALRANFLPPRTSARTEAPGPVAEPPAIVAEVDRQLGGNGLWTDQPATNFVTVTYDPEAKKPDAERLGARASRAFLGVRLDCAQCHDHPFQPWKQADFQGLAAFFAPVRSGFTGIHD